MSEHTKEPWSQQYDDNGFYEIMGAPQGMIAFTCREGHTDEANARRIVACINALEGVSTEHLEKYGIPDFAEKISVLQKQRDQLREALELALRQNSNDMLLTGEELRLCEAALAATGGE